jgi:ankyrin repeat protein
MRAQKPSSLVMDYAMESACQRGDAQTITWLLDEGKNVNCLNDDGTTPIMVALKYGQLHIVKYLFDRGADPSIVDGDASNVLHYAAGTSESIEWVLANSTIDINSTNASNATPLRWALGNSNLPAAILLIENGANIFVKNR